MGDRAEFLRPLMGFRFVVLSSVNDGPYEEIGGFSRIDGLMYGVTFIEWVEGGLIPQDLPARPRAEEVRFAQGLMLESRATAWFNALFKPTLDRLPQRRQEHLLILVWPRGHWSRSMTAPGLGLADIRDSARGWKLLDVVPRMVSIDGLDAMGSQLAMVTVTVKPRQIVPVTVVEGRLVEDVSV